MFGLDPWGRSQAGLRVAAECQMPTAKRSCSLACLPGEGPQPGTEGRSRPLGASARAELGAHRLSPWGGAAL